jgi:hypothetical protein
MPKTKKEELLPCPICGAEAETIKHQGKWFVACIGNAGFPCPHEIYKDGRNSMHAAIAIWNERITLENTLRCPHCKKKVLQ